MGKRWQQMNLEGAGLQSLSLALAQLMVSRPRAYALWVLFPFGAHRLYLSEHIGAAIYVALTIATVGVWWSVGGWYPLVTLVPLVLMALYDLYWIEGRVAEYNKELRKSLYLRGGSEAAPPRDFSGRFNDADEHEAELDTYLAEKEGRAAGERRRAPSLDEQEAMLRAMRKSKGQEQPSDAPDSSVGHDGDESSKPKRGG